MKRGFSICHQLEIRRFRTFQLNALVIISYAEANMPLSPTHFLPSHPLIHTQAQFLTLSVQVTDVLHHYSQLLLAVAYLLPPDVHRFVEEETQRVNLAILANRRSYTQLCSHLMTGEEGRGREGGWEGEWWEARKEREREGGMEVGNEQIERV